MDDGSCCWKLCFFSHILHTYVLPIFMKNELKLASDTGLPVTTHSANFACRDTSTSIFIDTVLYEVKVDNTTKSNKRHRRANLGNKENGSLAIMATAIADPKLQHLLTKIIKQSSGEKLSSKQILDTLLNKHREYRRKNSASLLTCVETLLTEIGKKQGLNTSVGANGIVVGRSAARKIQIPTGVSSDDEQLSKKRRREEESDEEYEKEASKHDLNQSEAPGSSMLNANLRNRYKDVQKERDIEQRKKAAEELKKANESDSELPTIPEDGRTTPTSATQKTVGTPSTKKKKKKISRSSSSSMLKDGDDSITITATTRPKERYSDLGGMSNILTQIRQLIEYPLAHPELFAHLGIDPPRGVLLRGPPGKVNL